MPRHATKLTLLLWLSLLGLPVSPMAQEAPDPPAGEQQEAEQKPAANAEEEAKKDELKREEAKKQEAKKKPPVEFNVELRWRSEIRDNADLQTANDFDHFVGQRVRLNFTFNLHERLSFHFQPQDVWLFGAERDKIIHEINTNLHQAYFDWNYARRDGTWLRIGRQEFNFAKQRLVGGFAWDNVGRTFDGVQFYANEADSSVSAFVGRLVDVRRRGGQQRPGNLDIAGFYSSFNDETPDVMDTYFFFLRDSFLQGGELGRTPEASGIYNLGFRFSKNERWAATKAGLRYEVENAWQFGDNGADHHRAAMLVVNGGYVWDAPLHPMLKVEYAFATGDGDPTDGKSREFHNFFPTNHLHYGYADIEGLRNLQNFRVTGGLQLAKKVRFETDLHKFLLTEKRGAWKNAGGAVLGVDPTGLSGRDVGQEIDFTLRLPLWNHLQLTAGYSVFLPGSFAKATRGPENHQWGFIQTVVRF